MVVREMIHQREQESLAIWATRSKESRGRAIPEEPCPIRTDFQRDRDRIVHCRAFRRLAHKTQVFILPSQDHIRTRLTHTLEVAQIAKTLSRALLLNEDLTEAIALGHDLGHTPFGHEGEWALDSAVKSRNPSERFYHWEQSLRVVDVLERDGRGLNLTWEVRQGILGHTKGRQDLPAASTGASSLEAQAVKMADRIAYVNHDLEDAIRARVIRPEDVPAGFLEVLGQTHSQRIGAVVADVVRSSSGIPELRISPPILDALNAFKEFLFERVYIPRSTRESQRVRNVVGGLFHYYCDEITAEKLPELDADSEIATPALPNLPAIKEDDALKSSPADSPCRQACDYVAGMTDRFAVQRYMQLFVPDAASMQEA